MKSSLKLMAAGLLALLLAAPAAAAVDGEVELRYWANDTELDIGTDSESAGMPGAGLRAEIAVFKRLAFAGEYQKMSGEDRLEDWEITTTQLDAKWRIIAPTENTFFALGVGYENFGLEVEGESVDSSSFRAIADGRFGFVGILYVYGRLAYLPSLSDLELDGETLAEGDTGLDLDIGLGIEPLPILTIWVGYRTQSFNFKNLEGSPADFNFQNSGAYLGVGVHF